MKHFQPPIDTWKTEKVQNYGTTSLNNNEGTSVQQLSGGVGPNI